MTGTSTEMGKRIYREESGVSQTTPSSTLGRDGPLNYPTPCAENFASKDSATTEIRERGDVQFSKLQSGSFNCFARLF